MATERIIRLDKFNLLVQTVPSSISLDLSIEVMLSNDTNIKDYEDLYDFPAYFKRTRWPNGEHGLEFVVGDKFLSLTPEQQNGIAETLRIEERESSRGTEITYRGRNGERSKKIRELLTSFV